MREDALREKSTSARYVTLSFAFNLRTTKRVQTHTCQTSATIFTYASHIEMHTHTHTHTKH